CTASRRLVCSSLPSLTAVDGPRTGSRDCLAHTRWNRRDDQRCYAVAAPRGSARILRPTFIMVFTKRLRDGIRRGRIRCSVRIWTRPHVKVGGRYRMGEGHIVVDSIASIELAHITDDLARESGFASVEDLLQIAKHGSGDNIY